MKLVKKYAAFSLLAIDKWLLDHPDDGMRSMLLKLLERRYDTGSTVFCTQCAKKDWHQRLGSGGHADAVTGPQRQYCWPPSLQILKRAGALTHGLRENLPGPRDWDRYLPKRARRPLRSPLKIRRPAGHRQRRRDQTPEDAQRSLGRGAAEKR